MFLFDTLELAGLYYDDPESCAACAPAGVTPSRAAWRGAEALSCLSDFAEHAVIRKAQYDDYGPDIMKRVGGCRGGRFIKLVPTRLPDGTLANPDPECWTRVGGY